ncbi:hypothetical protein [Aurantiacibacter sediminis]|uniref:Uncharacterized protein n=1 Tax=Aurantiacibacter sediminis TaxID=2793064 RepID=A0ABS0N461_9SPHN|nr:hypothetical protein [Aurantiacibacter sediminis]MBH5322742.1 hypothetical protein [Aurantiacibacter sediminis]
MKKLIFAAAALPLALAACADEGVDEPVEAEIAELEPAGEAIGATYAGTYTSEGTDGATLTTTLTEDGIFTDYIDGEVVRTGTWSTVEDNVCFTEEGALDADPLCYEVTDPDAEGNVEWTSPDGETATMTRSE